MSDEMAGSPEGPESDNENKPGAQKPFGLSSIVATLKNIKELLLMATFLGGALVWVVNYFATHEQLEQLECITKVNVRMLQARANVNYTDQVAKQARGELRDEQRMLGIAQKMKAAEDVRATQGRIDDLNEQIAGFSKNKESENKAAQKALAALTQNLCLIKDQRTQLLTELAKGDF